MNNRKRKALALSALLLTAAAFVAAASMHTQTLEDPPAASTAIREATNTLPKQPGKYMDQPEGKMKQPAERAKPAKNKKADPDAGKAVLLSDIYSENGKDAVFRCFDEEASSYTWEIYDQAEKEWEPAPKEAVTMEADELGRETSWFKVPGAEEATVRCTLEYPKKKKETQTASLYLLENNIEKVTAEDYVTDPGTYVCIEDIPVTVTYQDQTEESLTGLNGLFFLVKEEKTDHKIRAGGNREETTATTISERSYIRIGREEKEIQIRYNGRENRQIETASTLKGEDSQPPVISSVEIAPFAVSNIDIPVTLTLSIDAEDDKTPKQSLYYAFALKGTPPEEIHWMRKNCFDVEITRNGTYAACARDESGNTARKEMEIITVDMKPPTIHVSLENPASWCQSNTIQVDADDASELQYSFRHADDTDAPEWSDCPVYTADRNGTYIIMVRDAAGNTAKTEATISNIDREAPVIQGIYEK